MKRFRLLLVAFAILIGGVSLTSCEIDVDELLKQQNINGYAITTRSNNYSMGYTGLFVWMEGSQPMCRIEAIAYDGYHFRCWNDSIYETPHTFAIKQSENFTAYFEKDR